MSYAAQCLGRRALRAGALGVPVALLSLLVGWLVAHSGIKVLGAAVVVAAIPLGLQLSARTLLLVTLVLLPVPLYMQSLHISLVWIVVLATWTAHLAAPRLEARGAREIPGGWWLLGFAVAVLSSFVRSGFSGADVSATIDYVVAFAVFGLCTSLPRSRADLDRCYRAVVGASLLALAIALLQVGGAHLPGMLSGAGVVQAPDAGVAADLRVAGPIGDYELFAEFLALAGTIATYFASTRRGSARLAYAATAVLCFIGVATTATRSGLLLSVAGAVLIALLVTRGGRRIWMTLGILAGIALAIPVIGVVERSVGAGFVFERLSQTQTHGGLLRLIDRSSVWPRFWSIRPRGFDLLFGSKPAFPSQQLQGFPHSLPLTLTFTLGVFGLVTFYGFALTLMWRSLRKHPMRGQPWSGYMLGGVLIGLFLLNEVKVEYVRVFNYQSLVWAMFGLVAAGIRLRTEDDGSAEGLSLLRVAA